MQNTATRQPSTVLRIGVTLDEALSPEHLPVRLTPGERAAARQLFSLVSIPDGQRLAARGGVASRGFIVVSGRAVAMRPGRRSVVLSRGSTIGLSSLRTGRPQRTAVHAVTDMQVLVLRPSDVAKLDELIPALAAAIDADQSDVLD